MSYRLFQIACLLAAALFLSMPLAKAQSTSPESLAAAKELLHTMNFNEQFKALLPTLLNNLKPAIVQGRSEVDRHYDALAPIVLEEVEKRLDELSEAAALVYSRNFSTEDLLALTAFYKTPTGKRLLEKMPVVSQETMAAGAKVGESVAQDLRRRMIEELRKKGVAI